jgi:hypothetical protein
MKSEGTQSIALRHIFSTAGWREMVSSVCSMSRDLHNENNSRWAVKKKLYRAFALMLQLMHRTYSKLNFCLMKFKLWYSIQSDLVRRKLAFYWIKNVIRVDIPTYKNSMSSEPDLYCRHSGIWLFHFGYILLFDQGMTSPYPRNIAALSSS